MGFSLRGSSPLARGTPLRMPIKARGSRFIPACAGNSLEYFDRYGVGCGSSPLARGTQFKNFPGTHPSRFIPACAGNSINEPINEPINTVHPRLRGELDSRNAGKIGIRGSSPLARGTQSGYSEGHNVLRFIPACAGNSARPMKEARSSSVHPRLRGELN